MEEIKDLHSDGGILIRCIRQSTLPDAGSAPKGGRVYLHLVGKIVSDEKGVCSTPVTFLDTREGQPFSFETGCEQSIPGIEQAVDQMVEGGQYEVTISPKYAFGDFGNPNGFHAMGKPIPSKATLFFVIDFLSFDSPKSSNPPISAEEAFSQAIELREVGNQLFKSNQLERAYRKYSQSIELVLSYETDPKWGTQARQNLIAAYLNIAAVRLKTLSFKEVIHSTTRVLSIDPKNIKALFRRGKAHHLLNNIEESKEDFIKVLEFDKNNSEARSELSILRKKLESIHKKEQKVFSNLFEKLAKDSSVGNLYEDKKEEIFTKCKICGEEMEKVQYYRHIIKKHGDKPKKEK